MVTNFFGNLLLQLCIFFLHDHFQEHFRVFQLLPPGFPVFDNVQELAVFLLNHRCRFGIVPESGRKRLSFQLFKPVFFCG